MTIAAHSLRRVFKYNGAVLADPSPNMLPDEVRTFYSATFPELLSAVVDGPTSNQRTLEYEFKRAVGTKGYGPCRS